MINSHSLELFIYLIDASPLSKDPRFVVETENGNRYDVDPTPFLAQTHKRFPNRQKILFGKRAATGEAHDGGMDYTDTEIGHRHDVDPALILAQSQKRFPNRQKILFGQRAARGEANDEAMDYMDTEFPDSPEGEDYVRVVYSKTGNIKIKWRFRR